MKSGLQALRQKKLTKTARKTDCTKQEIKMNKKRSKNTCCTC